MAHGARLGSVVTFVQDLGRSVSFYTDVLALEVADRSPTAALLVSAAGAQLILRAMGQNAAHALGSIGVQYVIWTPADRDDLHRCERVLKKRSAYRQTHTSASITVVEGRDPDDITVMIAYPGPDEVPMGELAARMYGW
jgi:catechol 2,3-dioxygenase-like lactoylglutathione lyase family enzyme